MHVKHSTPVDAQVLLHAKCFTSLQVRRSKYESCVVLGSSMLSKDWERTFGEVLETRKGGGSPAGHLAALAFPECLPERISILAYITDYILYHDGMECERIDQLS